MDSAGLGQIMWLIIQCLALTVFLYTVAVYVIGRIRITDWVGYVLAAGGIAFIPFELAKSSVWLALGGVALALAAGLVWARATVKFYRERPDEQISGFFTFGRPPERVKDWPGWGSRSGRS